MHVIITAEAEFGRFAASPEPIQARIEAQG